MTIDKIAKHLEIPNVALYKGDSNEWEQFREIDSPTAFNQLPKDKQQMLLEWCEGLGKRKTTNPLHDTYTIKHLFSYNYFYITNGAMKGALLSSGFTSDDTTRLNWKFNISEKSLKKEYRQMGVIC